MKKKEWLLTIVVPTLLSALGLLPTIYEKRGREVPEWALDAGLVVTILCVCILIFHLLEWLVRLFTQRQMQMSKALAWMISSSLFVLFCSFLQQGHAIENYKKWSSDRNEVISNMEYFNETVVVDGKTFDHCKFTNPTLLYHGLAPTTFLESTFTGTVRFRTDNQAAKGALFLESVFRKNPNILKLSIGSLDPTTGKPTYIEEFSKEPTPVDAERQNSHP